MPALIAFTAVLLMGGSPALAHGSENHLSQSIWTFDSWIVIPLGTVGTLYTLGLWNLWPRLRESRKTALWRAVAYAVGWFTLAGALVSPLHSLGEHLFTFHMIEHEILMAISAPMLVIARPVGAFMWALPGNLRRLTAGIMKAGVAQIIWGWSSRGTVATVMHATAIWAWHAPLLFDAAVTNVALHRLQHFSFFATAILFWWSVLWRSDRGVAAWHLFLTMLHTSVLGALMALAPHVLYVAQTRSSETWRLTPLEDQQLAGIVMWIPAGTVYAGATLMMAYLWIANSSTEGRHVAGPGHL